MCSPISSTVESISPWAMPVLRAPAGPFGSDEACDGAPDSVNGTVRIGRESDGGEDADRWSRPVITGSAAFSGGPSQTSCAALPRVNPSQYPPTPAAATQIAMLSLFMQFPKRD